MISNKTLKSLSAKTKIALIDKETERYEVRIAFATINLSERIHKDDWKVNFIK